MSHFSLIISALQRLGRSFGGPLAVATLVMVTQATAHASQATFAQFTQASSGTPFSFTNTGGNSAIVTVTASTQVNFNFTTATGLSTTTHEATLSLTASTNTAATTGTSFGNTYYNQAINGGGSTSDVLTITDNNTGQHLLTMTFTGTIIGQQGNTIASLSGNSDPAGGSNVVTYSSDYLNLTGLQPSSYQIGLQALSVPFSLGAGNFLSSFMSSFTGSFQTTLVPEPASIAMFGTGLLATLVLAWQRKRRPLSLSLSPQTA